MISNTESGMKTNEQIVATGKFQKNFIACCFFVLSAISALIGLIAGVSSYYSGSTYLREHYSIFSHVIVNCLDMGNWFGLWYIGAAVLLGLGYLYQFMLGNCEITVSDKRVWGKTSFGKRVDLPFNQISAVGYGNFGSISVGTASGHVSFWYLENKNEIHDAITQILVSRQSDSVAPKQASIPEELIKFKELLDMDIITQEEFDAKKKQLLGL